GRAALRAARALPQDGVLLSPERLTPFCGNRADLLIPQFYDPRRHRIDVAWYAEGETAGRERAAFEALRESGDFRAQPLDGGYVRLTRREHGASGK
ncbi:MAG: hypothetical protein JW951_05490, partial [Lentisphaerae bacterium]|nr:hypothetical protein [Lentisphaerota bacterium]